MPAPKTREEYDRLCCEADKAREAAWGRPMTDADPDPFVAEEIITGHLLNPPMPRYRGRPLRRSEWLPGDAKPGHVESVEVAL